MSYRLVQKWCESGWMSYIPGEWRGGWWWICSIDEMTKEVSQDSHTDLSRLPNTSDRVACLLLLTLLGPGCSCSGTAGCFLFLKLYSSSEPLVRNTWRVMHIFYNLLQRICKMQSWDLSYYEHGTENRRHWSWQLLDRNENIIKTSIIWETCISSMRSNYSILINITNCHYFPPITTTEKATNQLPLA